MADMTLSDIAALNRNNDWGGDSLWVIVLFALIFGWGNNGFNNNSFANAIGYENLATSNEVQRGFDNQNSMANQREILAAVNAGTMQGIQTTNQVFHDTIGALSDKYTELQRDIAGLAVGQANQLAKQNDCCCSTLRAIDGVNYNIAMQGNQIIQAVKEEGAITRAQIQQDKIDAMAARIAELENQQNLNPIMQRLSMMPTYPNGFTYNAGPSPYCNCGGMSCCNNI